MNILFIPQPGNEEPWRGDFVRALDGRHELVYFAPDRPLAGQFAGIDVVLDQGGHGTRPLIDAAAAAGVRLWQVLGTGLDDLDVDHVLGTGLRLANTPGQFSAPALAEHALLFLLCFAKNLREAERNARAGRMYLPLNEELGGRTLGLIGLGASGKALARLAAALGMRVIAVDVLHVPDDVLRALGVEWCGDPERQDELLREADYVSLHVPLTSETRHLIDRRALALMKPSAVLVNVARGAVVDVQALIEALDSGRLRGACTDVFADEPIDPRHPLLRLDRVIATPHVAGATRETSRRRARACVENIDRLEQGLDPRFEVEPLGRGATGPPAA